MKIKDKVSGEVYEAETWKNWNGVIQYVKKGTNGPIRYGDDVEIIEEEKPKDTTGWDSFRREAAKDILSKLCEVRIPLRKEEIVRMSIEYADELIKQLKERARNEM